MDVEIMSTLQIAYYLITLLFLLWGSEYIAEHTPCNNIWDTLITLGGIIFLCWYSLMFLKVVFGV